MYKNIGKKIMSLAKFLCWVGIVVSVIIGVLAIFGTIGGGQGTMIPNLPTDGSEAITVVTSSLGGSSVNGYVAGILIIVLGSLASWIGSWMMYAFGELVQNTKKIAENVGSDKE